jgi:YD repeat-containing protein
MSVRCASTPRFPDNAVSNTRTSYDDHGNPIKDEVAKNWAVADKPEYLTDSTASYDEHGRVIEGTDAAGSLTRTSYTPRTGGPVTEIVTTGPPTPAVPAGQPTQITDANGKLTEFAYDPLGRKTEVWLANRPHASNARGNVQFSYLIRQDAPTVVTTTAIGPNGNYTSGKVLFDGLLRPRQQQAPRPAAGACSPTPATTPRAGSGNRPSRTSTTPASTTACGWPPTPTSRA